MPSLISFMRLVVKHKRMKTRSPATPRLSWAIRQAATTVADACMESLKAQPITFRSPGSMITVRYSRPCYVGM
jgi:hypothetical protein